MKILNYIPIYSVISDIYRDLGIDDISEADAIEWGVRALKFMDVHGVHDINTEFIEVENYQCPLPSRAHQVLQIARHNSEKKLPKKPAQMFYEVPDNKCGCSEPQPVSGCGCQQPPTTRLCVCQSYVNNWGFYMPFVINRRCRERREWTLVMPTNNNFFGLGRCERAVSDKFDEYSIDNGRVLFSFKKGIVAISYEAYRSDENGVPLIPDDVSATEAITKFIIMKYMQRQWYLGRDGYQDKMMKAEQDWQWYCKQFVIKMVMPSEDEYRKLAIKQRRLIPQYSKDFFGYIALKDKIDEGHGSCENEAIGGMYGSWPVVFMPYSSFPAQGNANRLYVDIISNDIYRWNGNGYVKVSDITISDLDNMIDEVVDNIP
ncbi:MAG: hypothetical protein II063_10330 [Prevotella sp.]|nr:hypothetical protein [Prevotella sp.]